MENLPDPNGNAKSLGHAFYTPVQIASLPQISFVTKRSFAT